jgi:hypothetical protein
MWSSCSCDIDIVGVLLRVLVEVQVVDVLQCGNDDRFAFVVKFLQERTALDFLHEELRIYQAGSESGKELNDALLPILTVHFDPLH